MLWIGLLIGIIVGIAGTFGFFALIVTGKGFYVFECIRFTLRRSLGRYKVIISTNVQKTCNPKKIHEILKVHFKEFSPRFRRYKIDGKDVVVSHRYNDSRTFVRLLGDHRRICNEI